MVHQPPKKQHRLNARDEHLWMTQAAADKRNLHNSAVELRLQGNNIRANFMQHESNIAGTFIGRRRKMLEHERRLGK
jgi:hypothetical protein